MQKRIVESGKWYRTEKWRKYLKSKVKIYLSYFTTLACTMSTWHRHEKDVQLKNTCKKHPAALSATTVDPHNPGDKPTSFCPIFFLPEDISWLNGPICLKKLIWKSINTVRLFLPWTYFFLVSLWVCKRMGDIKPLSTCSSVKRQIMCLNRTY